MKLLVLAFLLVATVIGAFAVLNWSALLAPSELSLGFTTVQMPLGLVMLGMLGFLAALFLIFVIAMQGSALMETRRHTRELQANRELADRAEASRFTELRGYIEAQLQNQADHEIHSRALVIARVDRLESDLRAFMEQSGNTLAAYIGELEDRLEHRTESGRVKPH